MTVLLANNVSSTLAADLTTTATSLTVRDASRFPQPTTGQYYYVTLIAPNGAIEIVKAVSKAGNALAVVRAQEGTVAQTFVAGARVEMRITANSVLDAVDDGYTDVTVVTDALDARLDAVEAKTVILDSVTASAAEINILDGATVSTAELNILDGVTGTTVDINRAVANTSYVRDTVAALLADTSFTYTAGTASTVTTSSYIYTRLGEHTYKVAASGATDHHLTTAGGVKLYVMPTSAGYEAAAFGVVGNGTTNDSPALQLALNAAKSIGGDVIVQPGAIVGIGTTVVIPSTTALLGGSGRKRSYVPTSTNSTMPEVRALSALSTNPMFTMANGDDVDATRRSFGIYGLRINGNNIATVGILARNAVQVNIENNYFGGFATGGWAIKVGGCVYVYVRRNVFVGGLYYAFDALDSYKGGTAHYYGANVGTFEENWVSAYYGIRYQGMFDILRNDFEFRTEVGTAIYVSPGENSYTNIIGNYFECSRATTNPTAGHTLIDLGTGVQNGVINGNYLSGAVDPANPIGIAVDTSKLIAGSIQSVGNWIADIEIGYKFDSLLRAQLDIGPNEFRSDVVTQYSGRVARHSVTAAGTLPNAKNHISIIDGGARLVNGAISFGAVFVQAQTGINLDHGNAFYISSLSGAVTYDTVLNAKQGQFFWVMAIQNNLVTLSNATFNLTVRKDLLLPQDRPILFMVDDSGVVREVGSTSLFLWSGTVANLPSATTLGAGARLIVTDATTTTFGGTVTGGGSNIVPVYSNGAAWRIG